MIQHSCVFKSGIGFVIVVNLIRHLLDRIPYEEVPRKSIKLPKRQKPHGYRESQYPYKYVEEHY